MELAVDVVLHQQQGLLGHLFAVAVDQLDAVIVVGIMAGGDHNAAVKIIHAGNVGHAGGGGDVQQVGICAGSGQSRYQRILKHIAASSCVFSDYDSGLVVLSEIPSKITSYFKCMLYCKNYIRLTTETICSKIFSHNNLPFLSCDTLLLSDLFTNLLP